MLCFDSYGALRRTPALKADVPSAPIAADSGDKRKLMWQGKSEAEKQVHTAILFFVLSSLDDLVWENAELVQLGKWSAADFGGDETRKNKFLALMGGKKYQADTAVNILFAAAASAYHHALCCSTICRQQLRRRLCKSHSRVLCWLS